MRYKKTSITLIHIYALRSKPRSHRAALRLKWVFCSPNNWNLAFLLVIFSLIEHWPNHSSVHPLETGIVCQSGLSGIQNNFGPTEVYAQSNRAYSEAQFSASVLSDSTTKYLGFATQLPWSISLWIIKPTKYHSNHIIYNKIIKIFNAQHTNFHNFRCMTIITHTFS